VKRFLAAIPLLFSAATLLAQDATRDDAAAAAAGGMMAVLGIGCWLFSCLGGIAFWLIVGFWIMKDAKARQSPNAQLVTILGWIPFTTTIALIVHLITRPKGRLVPCPHCQKKRLEGSAVCPNCGQP
jgi:hypothetical protein